MIQLAHTGDRFGSFSERIFHREWLETDGRGGYAGSTISGAHTRRYHGLLCVPLSEFGERHVLFSKMAARVRLSTGSCWELDTNIFRESAGNAETCCAPHGHQFLEAFNLQQAPTWRYQLPDGSRLQIDIMMVHGEPITLLNYQFFSGKNAAPAYTLELAPFIAGRNVHNITRQNTAIQIDPIWNAAKNTLYIKPYPGYPAFSIIAPQPDSAQTVQWNQRPQWWNTLYYTQDEARGFRSNEDLFNPGFFSIPLSHNSNFTIALCAPNITVTTAPAILREHELERRTARFGPTASTTTLIKRAAEQFLTTDAHGAPGIVAGYPWFERWGRDTLVALPALAKTLGSHSLEREILEQQLSLVERGLVPNLILANGERLYNSIDAVLWLFNACHHYTAATEDYRWMQTSALPILRGIVTQLHAGTDYGIHVNAEGLLCGGSAKTQLTWMDARVDGVPITPRHGAAVEINALWYNALRVFAEYSEDAGEKLSAVAKARALQRTFLLRFRHPEFGLADTESGSGTQELRPNQLFAVSLPFPVVEDDVLAGSIMDIVRSQLLTARGLRTLHPSASQYRSRYDGGPDERDSAYHQGTVWPWLLMPYAQSLQRLNRGDELCQLKAQIIPMLEEGCLGSIAEVYDGSVRSETGTQLPGGCFAQAWSVAAIATINASSN